MGSISTWTMKRGFALSLVSLCLLGASCQHSNKVADQPFATVDHVYLITEKKSDFTSLEKRGFVLSEHVRQHPGLECRYIFFRKNRRERTYLEWCLTDNYKELQKESPLRVRSGLSFTAARDLRVFSKELKKELPNEDVRFSHKNYDWENDKSEDGPGWNFLSFGRTLFKNIYVFVTQYDPRPKSSKKFLKPGDTRHPNRARELVGLIVEGPSRDMEVLGRLVGGQTRQGVLPVGSGVSIVNLEGLDKDAAAKSNFKKETQLKAVVLRTDNLALFNKEAKPDLKIDFRGTTFSVIRTADYAWDIWVTDNRSWAL